jgi:hypothetical integral membrane protein (TIGR02206 family)
MHAHYVVEIFSNYWWKGLLFSIAGIFLCVALGYRMAGSKKEWLASCLGWSLILINIFHQFYMVSRNEWTFQSSLPLNLCSISAMLSGVALILRKQLLYEFLLYWGIAGALHSLLTPEMTLGNKGWHPYDYYISHAGIMMSCIYLSVVLKFYPRPGSWWRILIYSQPLLLFVYMVNVSLGANYMYLLSKPAADNPFVIGKWPWYIIGFQLAGVMHFYITWLLFKKRTPSPELVLETL